MDNINFDLLYDKCSSEMATILHEAAMPTTAEEFQRMVEELFMDKGADLLRDYLEAQR